MGGALQQSEERAESLEPNLGRHHQHHYWWPDLMVERVTRRKHARIAVGRLETTMRGRLGNPKFSFKSAQLAQELSP